MNHYETPRLLLKPLALEDYQQWTQFYTCSDTPPNPWAIRPKSEEEVRYTNFEAIVQAQNQLALQDETYRWMLVDKTSHTFIGYVSIMNIIRSVTQSAYLGYAIHHHYWQQGYGKEAVLEILRVAFTDLKLHRLEAGIEPNNEASIALCKSIGLREEGLKKRIVFLRNQWLDLATFAITSEELGYPFAGDTPKLPH